MFVAKRMTPNPVSISPSTMVSEAVGIMRSHKFRRLPVVDNGKLIGIITDRDLRDVSPSPATTLSIYELNYLLAKMKVSEIMIKDVITIDVEATIEEAALTMYTKKIGGLVVVDSAQKVVGIITETDVFKCFVDVMGLLEGRTRITLEFEDKVGALHEISGVFKDLGINILSMASQHLPGDWIEQVIRADIQDTKELTRRLATLGYRVVHIVQIGNHK
ncbi:MAG: CBS and ACT domain-containing protein [Negativicutes bacterium]|nr:CBS and ACT domain-containing protein [Negativicutes bacterium]